MDIGNLPGKQFTIMIMKMIQDLRKRMKKMKEMFTKSKRTKEQRNREQHITRNQQQNN